MAAHPGTSHPGSDAAGRASGRQPPPHLQKDGRGEKEKVPRLPSPHSPIWLCLSLPKPSQSQRGRKPGCRRPEGQSKVGKGRNGVGGGVGWGGGDIEKNPLRHGILEA